MINLKIVESSKTLNYKLLINPKYQLDLSNKNKYLREYFKQKKTNHNINNLLVQFIIINKLKNSGIFQIIK